MSSIMNFYVYNYRYSEKHGTISGCFSRYNEFVQFEWMGDVSAGTTSKTRNPNEPQ